MREWTTNGQLSGGFEDLNVSRKPSITGSSSGIGAASAVLFSQRGWDVCVNYSRDPKPAEAVAATCRGHGAEVMVERADVSDDAQCVQVATHVKQRFGRCDVLVNNAGTTKFVDLKDLHGLNASDFQRIYSVNVIGPFQMTRAFAPLLRDSGGAGVVNVSSIAAQLGAGSSIAYVASKALERVDLEFGQSVGTASQGQRGRPEWRFSWLKQGLGPNASRPAQLPVDLALGAWCRPKRWPSHLPPGGDGNENHRRGAPVDGGRRPAANRHRHAVHASTPFDSFVAGHRHTLFPEQHMQGRFKSAAMWASFDQQSAGQCHQRRRAFGLIDGVAKLAQDPEIKIGVLACEGRTFMAGADITEFGKPPLSPGLHEAINAVENSGKPIVAAIHGTALGGGLEVALACHYRVAIASAKVGLPEVKLGILPGAGGTQRLPRLIGIEAALAMIVSGDPIPAAQAAKSGIIDKIIDGDLLEGAIAHARTLIAQKAPARKIRDIDIDAGKLPAGFFDAARKRIAQEKKNLFAPQRIVDALEAAATLPFDQGLARERELIVQCMQNSQAKALQHVFFRGAQGG